MLITSFSMLEKGNISDSKTLSNDGLRVEYKNHYIVLDTLNSLNMSDSLVEQLTGIKKFDMIVPRGMDTLGIDYFKYKKTMARLESGGCKNPYTVVNRFGYTGKYQFGMKLARKLLNKPKLTRREFKRDPYLQEAAMDSLIVHNIKVLKNYGLDKYIGKTVNKVEINLEGMLAASHLVGPYAVKKFIKSGGIIVKRDGNKTPLTKYMKELNKEEGVT